MDQKNTITHEEFNCVTLQKKKREIQEKMPLCLLKKLWVQGFLPLWDRESIMDIPL